MQLPEMVPSRVVIEGVAPEIDAGQFPAKRTVGEQVVVEADIHCDGHEVLNAVARYRAAGEDSWHEVPLSFVINDRWKGAFTVTQTGWYEYTLDAWIDRFGTWRRDLIKKVDAQQEVTSELLEGAQFVREAAARASGSDAQWLSHQADVMGRRDPQESVAAALDEILLKLMQRHAAPVFSTTYDRVLRVWVDRTLARYGAWYELFPRSTADEPGRHGTFADVERRLPYVAQMGLDVLYLLPSILLDTLMLAKAVHDLTNELNNRPDWVRIPMSGLASLLGIAPGVGATP